MRKDQLLRALTLAAILTAHAYPSGIDIAPTKRVIEKPENVAECCFFGNPLPPVVLNPYQIVPLPPEMGDSLTGVQNPFVCDLTVTPPKVSPVPEPGTLVVCALGLMCLGLANTRARRKG